MADEKRSYTWIIYIGVAGAVIAIGIAIWSYISGLGQSGANTSANQNVTTCYDDVQQIYYEMGVQINAFYKANGNATLTAQQESVINGYVTNAASAEANCSSLASSTNAAEITSGPGNAFNNAINELVDAGIIIAAVYAAIKLLPSAVTAGQRALNIRQNVASSRAATGEASTVEASAMNQQSATVASDTYASIDSKYMGDVATNLGDAYNAAIAANDAEAAATFEQYLNNLTYALQNESTIIEALDGEAADYLASL